MKKLLILLAIFGLVLAGCSSGKYADKIDKVVNKQQQYQKKLAKQQKGDVERKFDKKDANIYVNEKGKHVTIAYKPFKNDEEVHYYTYKFKDGKAKYIKDFNSKGYLHKHEPDYKEENMDLEE
ncbi:cystatin-like fold lipoprotein [Staphylococcus xylosus]|uniref:cystatin-like fold lipoprotein n=1 Tax=Staphylococcus xylosus TaxID=1288 RepID=UPI001CDCEF7C|nr:cystatin-like fold lipoprotein [Staphylococcus xylosus]UBV35227.1 cystatin-like fold lipoprotein [Staphylococcus xylosus]